jgi:hypothetical protein
MNPKDNPSTLQEGIDKLLSRHKQAWAELWKTGDIQIEDLDAQQRVRFALYNLYSYPSKTDQSIAPMGLSSQGYNGHIFGILNFGCTQRFWRNPIWQNHVLIIVLIVCRKQSKSNCLWL